MDIKKINIALESLKYIHKSMDECANKYILADSIKEIEDGLKITTEEKDKLFKNMFTTSDFFIRGKLMQSGFDSDMNHYLEYFLNNK